MRCASEMFSRKCQTGLLPAPRPAPRRHRATRPAASSAPRIASSVPAIEIASVSDSSASTYQGEAAASGSRAPGMCFSTSFQRRPGDDLEAGDALAAGAAQASSSSSTAAAGSLTATQARRPGAGAERASARRR
jgi:hypothetical protein